MNRIINTSCFLLALLLFSQMSMAQNKLNPHLVEVSGVILSADSATPVSSVVVSIMHKNTGVIANNLGIFTLVCEPGDTLRFSSVGYKSSKFVLPSDYKGKFYNRVQLIRQDTFYLPETVIEGLPTGEAFIYAFKYWPVTPDINERALARFSKNNLDYLRQTLPMDGGENASLYQYNRSVDASFQGLQRSGVGLLSPISWMEFIDAWKRGDFKNKNKGKRLSD